MFGKRYKLFDLFGFPLYIDLSWLFIVVLVTWSLAQGVFPALWRRLYAGEPTTEMLWLMGVLGAVGLFASIVLHELAHALVARRQGMPIKGITLFIFGGVAEMGGEPPNARAEFRVAVAGPIASVLISAACFLANMVAYPAAAPPALVGVLGYLASINLVLVVFNMIPAFPLDGGRVLRSALWHWKKDLNWATRVSSEIGAGFGLALILLGVVSVISGNFIGGLWWILIGLFLRSAAKMSYQHVLVRRTLEGEPVEHFMNREPHDVAPDITLQTLVYEHVYRLHHRTFPVTDHGRLLGCVTTRQILQVPRDQWDRTAVGEVMEACGDDDTVRPNDDAMEALSRMNRTHSAQMFVVDHGTLTGVITLKDLTRAVGLKMELEGDAPAPLAMADSKRDESW